jgi:hypothetical protein
MKYVALDTAGVPMAFYDTAVHGPPDEDGSLIPAGAVAIGDETWQEMVDNPGRRRLVDGQIVAIPVPIEVGAGGAAAGGGRRGGATRDAWRTPGKDAVYARKVDEAVAWRAAGEPVDLTPYPHIAAETGITAPTAADLVALWEAMAAAWIAASAQVEAVEQSALKAIREAADAAVIDAVLAGLNWPLPPPA